MQNAVMLANQPFMLSVIMLSGIMLNVVMLSVVAPVKSHNRAFYQAFSLVIYNLELQTLVVLLL